ncbi:MAG: hypothetical protein ACK46L_13165 [Synechococcaceae cyanobacterium]|jgi:hypothetical protein
MRTIEPWLFPRIAGRLGWLLIRPLVLQPALPAAALEAGGKGFARTPEPLLAQAPSPAGAGIPKEMQGWFDAAKAADT